MFKFLKKIFRVNRPRKHFAHVMYEYHEKDTKCDLCSCKDECDLIDITTLRDTRRHFISGIDNVCRLED